MRDTHVRSERIPGSTTLTSASLRADRTVGTEAACGTPDGRLPGVAFRGFHPA